MKKFSIALTAILLVFLLVFSVSAEFIGTSKNLAVERPYMQSENLALQYDSKATDGKTHSVHRFKKRQGDFITVDLGKEQTLNHIILKEKGLNVKRFSLSASTDGEQFQEFYKGDKIEFHRLCTFQDVTARYIKLTVLESDLPAKLREIEIYNEQPEKREAFDVSAYSTVHGEIYNIIDDETIPEEEKDAKIQKLLQKEYFSTVTEYILIGCISFDENGIVSPIGWDKKERDEEKYFGRMMKNLHALLDETNTEITATILNPWGEGANAKMMKAITENRDTLMDNMIAFCNRYEIDNIDLDWEFPLSKEEFDAYNPFLQDFKAKMQTEMWNKKDAKLSIAVATWALQYTPETIACLDAVNVMGYDILDQDGYHSSFFSSCVQAANYIEHEGFPKEKIRIGFPFYGTCIRKNMEQYGYNSIPRETIDPFENLYTLPHSKTKEDRLVYFNSASVIRDKTAYAYLNGYKGVMIFSLYCDIPCEDSLSLTSAIQDYLKEARA